jgi:hypothetical protein
MCDPSHYDPMILLGIFGLGTWFGFWLAARGESKL